MTGPYILGDIQTMLRDSAERWADPRDVRAAESFGETWRHFAEMGWLAAAIPEEAGGLGGDARDTAIVAEALGRGLIRAPFVEVAGVAATLLAAIAPDRLAAIGAGESRPILAHDEAGARGDPAWIETRAMRDGAGWKLSGRKTGIVGAPLADRLIVSAIAEGDSPALFEIAAGDAPLWRFTTFDDRAAGELRLDGTAAQRLGTGDALPHIRRAFDHALVIESAEALGAMQRALEITCDYLMTRRQFGQAIGEFQALRHRLADMFIEVEQARSIILRALGMLGSDDERARGLLAAATRARTAQAGTFVTAQAIQLHGGIGMTDEYVIGHYFKRLIAFDQRHGTAAVQVERFAELSAEVIS